MIERHGDPLSGRDLERLKAFLLAQGLAYDEGIEHTVVLEEDGRVLACGSVRGNVVECVAVDPAARGTNLLGAVMTHLVGWLAQRGFAHYFCFTKPSNKAIFESLGLLAVEETVHTVLLDSRKAGLQRFLEKLVRQAGEQMAAGRENRAGRGVAAVVANCNPFTLGHRFLMEEAARASTWLHVFVVGQEQPFMPTSDRVRLVREGTAHLRNVIVHEGGDYVVSPATFPTYFLRDKEHALEANCELDVRIFARHVAPALGIVRRFVGTEPACPLTARYNDCMAELLPSFGVELVVVPRLQAAGRAVSARDVRRLAEQGEFAALEGLVPASTGAYLAARATGPAVDLEEVLEARERRAARQRQMLGEGPGTVVSFGLNVPGPVKVMPHLRWAFWQETKRIEQALSRAGVAVLDLQRAEKPTGYEGLARLDCDALAAKRVLVEVEEADELGRLFDIDVLRPDGTKVARGELGASPRRCLLCGRDAFVCARSRAHPVEQVLARIEAIVRAAQKETC